MSTDDKSKQMSQDAFWELAKRAGDPPTSILAAGPVTTIDDERAAFIRDLLRVLTSLYSWAGAVVHGQTDDGHDVIELCDGTRVETSAISDQLWGARVSGYGWITQPATRTEHLHRVASVAVIHLAGARIRDLLTGPP